MGRQLVRLRYVRAAVECRADLSRFRQRPRRRLFVGIVLVFLGLLFGWPVVTLLGLLAAALQEPMLVTMVAPGIYALSWVIYLAGFLVGGAEALRYVRDFNRWLTRVTVEWLLGESAPQPPRAGP